MMKRAFTVCMLVVLFAGLSFAQFGKLPSIGKKSGGAGVDADSLISQANAINTDFVLATYALADSYAIMLDIADKKESAAKLRDAVVHAKAEPVDKQAKFLVTPLDEAQREIDIEAATLESKKLGDKDKLDIARISFNVAVAALKDKSAIEKTAGLLPKTQDAIRQVGSDPMGATKLTKLQGAATALTGVSSLAPTQVKALTGMMGTLSKMRKTNSVSDEKIANATATSSFDNGEDAKKGI